MPLGFPLVGFFSHSGPHSLSRLFHPNVVNSFYHPFPLGPIPRLFQNNNLCCVTPGMPFNRDLSLLFVSHVITE